MGGQAASEGLFKLFDSIDSALAIVMAEFAPGSADPAASRTK